MKRTLAGAGGDPLLLFLLAAIGAADVSGCGGISARAASGRNGDDSDNPIMGSSAGGMTSLAGRPPGEGVVACTMSVPYPVSPVSSPPPDPAPDTGFFACSNSSWFIHRAVVEACPTPLAEPGPYPDGCPLENYCRDLPNGRCQPPVTACGEHCLSECQSDSDCQSNELCLCDAQINHCVPASCHSDAECGQGLLCIAAWPGGPGVTSFSCQNADDECTASCTDYDTSTSNGVMQHLFGTCGLTVRADGSEQRDCSYSTNRGGCGRPFLVQGAALVADVARRRDWAARVYAEHDVDAVMPELRRALAASWREAALMEHASIAAFARFSLELLALGAPSELVRDAAQAMADEQRHAELCFGLASAYAGVPLGPGVLDVRSCLQDVSLATVLVTTFLEGCIGETLAAVDARERARRVHDPVLEAALHRIAEDESRHAALAWRFVKWALAESAAGMEDVLFAALETERERLVTGEPLPRGVSDELARAHGLSSFAERARLRREALDEIVTPCLAALCPPRASDVFHTAPSGAGARPAVSASSCSRETSSRLPG